MTFKEIFPNLMNFTILFRKLYGMYHIPIDLRRNRADLARLISPINTEHVLRSCI